MTERAKSFEEIYLEPGNLLLSAIMSNGKSYAVPRFQRDYSWESAHWEELWDDIEEMRTKRVQHFMGYLVLRSNDKKHFEVIDGQQRLTTLSIIVLVAMAQLQALIDKDIETEANRERIDIYNSTYIIVKDAATLKTEPKLILNRHNRNHFRHLTQTLKVITERNLIRTNRQLNSAFRFFRKKITYESGKQIASLLSDIADGLLFTTITVRDEMNAFTVFETLNARGIHLSTSDLLKNYLLSSMAKDESYSKQDLDEFEEDWQGIVEQLGENEFTKFLRSYEAMSRELITDRELFSRLKRNINQPNQVMQYLQSLREMAPIYAALQDHNDGVWIDNDGRYREARKHLEVLNIFKVKTPLALLMAGYKCLSPSHFIDLAQLIVVISIRYNVICERSRSDQERVYNRIANKIMSRSADMGADMNEIIQLLSPLYPSDREFRTAFKEKSMPSRSATKRIRYLLYKIERQLHGDELPSTLTLEHVLPYSPIDEWQSYFGRDNYANAINRLGNLAILPENRQLGQDAFGKKRKILQESDYRINHNIAKYSEWDMDNLRDHQGWLAQQAIGIWKISQLSKSS